MKEIKMFMTKGQPAFYDSETATAIEMVGRLYSTMKSFVEEYNETLKTFQEEVNTFEENTSNANECFKTKMVEMMNDFIDSMNMVHNRHSKEIEEATKFMKDGVAEKITEVVEEMVASGEIDSSIMDALGNFETQINEINTHIQTLIEKTNTLDENVESVNAVIQTITSEIDEINNLIGTFSNDIETINNLIATLNHNIETINNQNTRNEKVSKGIARKLLPITGKLREAFNMSKDVYDRHYCIINSVDDTKIEIAIQNPYSRKFNIVFDDTSPSLYEIRYISTYGVNRTSLYSGSGLNKTLNHVLIDDVTVNDLESLKKVGFTFKSLLINYTVSESETVTFNVTLIITPDGAKVIETVNGGNETQLTKGFLTGTYFKQVFKHGNNIQFVQSTNNNIKTFQEKVEDLGTTVIKTIKNGGVI